MNDKEGGRLGGLGLFVFSTVCSNVLAKTRILRKIGQPAVNSTGIKSMVIVIPHPKPDPPCDGTKSAYSGRRRGTLPGIDTQKDDEFSGLID